VEGALEVGTLTSVRLYLFLEGRSQGSKVELTAKGGRNVVEIDREDVELATVVRAYFLARGVLRRASRVKHAARAEA
jgi:hypothetical protein